LDRAPASREEDLGCLTAVSFPLWEGLEIPKDRCEVDFPRPIFD
jgi:hypothetical protein